MGLNDTLREFLTVQPGQLRIDIHRIRPNPNQPRQSIDEASEQFLELRSSILAHDLLQPVLLCRPDKGGTYVLLAGERRWRAFCSLAQLDAGRFSTIPAVIQNDLPHGPEVSPMIIGLLENCVREDLKPGERAAAVARIRGKTGWTFREIGQHMGLTEPRVQELAAVGRHEVLVQALNQGDINQEKAILVARAARNDQQLALELTGVAQRIDKLIGKPLGDLVLRNGVVIHVPSGAVFRHPVAGRILAAYPRGIVVDDHPGIAAICRCREWLRRTTPSIQIVRNAMGSYSMVLAISEQLPAA